LQEPYSASWLNSHTHEESARIIVKTKVQSEEVDL